MFCHLNLPPRLATCDCYLRIRLHPMTLRPPSMSKSSLLRSPTRIGCAGWTIPRETTQFYAAGSSHLERYAQIFNACEINSSFYRPHRIETWKRWGESVRDGFLFSVKAPRTITHESGLSCGAELLEPFFHQISFLKDKLGPVLFQLPPKLEFAPVSVRRFLSCLRQIYAGDVVWEPRHPTWFGEKAEAMLEKFDIARVAADPARAPSGAQPGGRRSLVYFRLHGSPRTYYSSYSEDYLHSLAERVADLAPAADVWCIFDNTAFGAAVPNALTLREQLSSASLVSFPPD
jgi:uncharacterized protein YecE (DUF72 family)